jgi:hypothetical protein
MRLWLSGRVARRREDAEALDAAVGGSDDFHAQSGGLEDDNFAGQRDASFDLADKAAEGGGFILLAEVDLFAEEVV